MAKIKIITSPKEYKRRLNRSIVLFWMPITRNRPLIESYSRTQSVPRKVTNELNLLIPLNQYKCPDSNLKFLKNRKLRRLVGTFIVSTSGGCTFNLMPTENDTNNFIVEKVYLAEQKIKVSDTSKEP